MASIKQLFQRQQAGLTVYSPDCAQSRLWGNLDHAIHEATGFQAVHRQWINHDFNSIMRFYKSADGQNPPELNPEEAAKKYDNIPAAELQYGHLVLKLFLSGPSLLTIWRGNNVVETLLTLRGATHPAQASAESIRGRFWCDNAVCNLIHASDDYGEAERELQAIHLTHLLDEEATQVPLIDAIAPPTSYVAHSGISMVCEVVNRVLVTMGGVERIPVSLPPSGDAKETNQILTKILQETALSSPGSPVAHFIDAHFAGDIIAVTRMLNQMPVTRWEHFIIQCGAITRNKWNK